MSRWRQELRWALSVLVLAACVAGAREAYGRLTHPAALRALALWSERARRLPLPVATAPDRRSLTVAGGQRLEVRAAQPRIHRACALPTSSPVVAIAAVGERLAVATFDDGVFWCDAPGATAAALGTAVNDLTVDGTGALIAAGDDGVYRLPISGTGPPEQLLASAAFAVTGWRDALWVAASDGLWRLSDRTATRFGPAQGMPAVRPAALAGCGDALCVGATDGLWTFADGVARRRGSADGSLPTDFVTAVAARNGVVWAGTFDGGLARLDTGTARRMTPADGLPDGRVQPRALVVLDDGVAAATPTGLLFARADGREATFLPSPSLDGEVTAVHAGDDGLLWLGHRGGVTLIDPRAPQTLARAPGRVTP